LIDGNIEVERNGRRKKSDGNRYSKTGYRADNFPIKCLDITTLRNAINMQSDEHTIFSIET
jgi:hypothetical protein